MVQQIIKFNLSGITGSFTKPHNPVSFLTYEHIHKPALLGLLGAILGKKGHSFKSEEFPEFYRDLKDLKVSIVPHKYEFKTEKIEYANLSHGNLKPHEEQVLINPSWEIYLYIEDEEIFNEIKEKLFQKSFRYNIYLGKTRHFANLDKVEVIKDFKEVEIDKLKRIKYNSLVIKEYLDLQDESPIDFCSENNKVEYPFLKQIYLPTEYLINKGIQYNEKLFIMSSYFLKIRNEIKSLGFTLNIYDKNLFFF